eukprot:COSAG01_NODE_28_length_36622_cov_14.695751_15_plen_70_part_00
MSHVRMQLSIGPAACYPPGRPSHAHDGGKLAAAAVKKADGCGAMYYELVVDAACGQQRREAPAGRLPQR